MNRNQALDAAIECVTKNRQVMHGPPENTFEAIARLWSAYLTTPGSGGLNRAASYLRPVDVCVMLALLKIGRIGQNPCHDDSWVDIAGYAALGAEMADRMKKAPDTE